MKHLVVITLVLFASMTTEAQRKPASSDVCPKSLRVDQFLLPDDAAAAKRSFENFRAALLKGDRKQVIAFMNFPADLVVDGRGLKIASAREFASKYDTIFTDYVISSVRDQKTDELLAGCPTHRGVRSGVPNNPGVGLLGWRSGVPNNPGVGLLGWDEWEQQKRCAARRLPAKCR